MNKIKIKQITKNQPRSVYDLGVEGNHNFFIGKTQILTHNCDYVTIQGQAALRNLMEAFSTTTRFILTCNYIEKIIDPIISRTQLFDVSPPSKKDVAVHLSDIFAKEGVTYEIADIVTLINAYYPDIRRVINTAQLQTKGGEFKLDEQTLIASEHKLKILDILDGSGSVSQKTTDVRQVLADAHIRDYTELYTLLYENIDRISKTNVPHGILAIADGQYRASFAVDQEICFVATIVQLLGG